MPQKHSAIFTPRDEGA